MSKTLRITFSFLLTLTAFYAVGQSGANSIFSRFGLGDLNGDNFVNTEYMGGIGAAYTDPTHINISNPASFAHLRATAFDVGINIKRTVLTDPQFSSNIWSGNLDYLSIAFPLQNPLNEIFDRQERDFWLGMNFALLPYSTVNYDITTNNENEEFGVYQSNFKGTGGTYKFQWGNSIRYKDFSYGVNLGYLFGKIQYESNTFFADLPSSYANNFFNNYTTRGFVWNMGVLYKHVLNKKAFADKKETFRKIVTIGIHGNSANNINTNSTQVLSNQRFGGAERDTFSFEESLDGNIKLPAEVGMGISYTHENRFLLELDYSFSKWSSYTNDSNPEDLSDTYEVNFGGFYRPNHKSFKYKNRIYYRFGAFARQDARSINQNSITNYGLTFGVGLPFIYQRKISHINLGLSLGKRGQSDALSETYVKLGVGLTFNDDEWFIKRKYN